MAQLVDEFYAPLVRLDPFVFDDLVDQVVLAVPEAIYCFGLRRIVRSSLGEFYTARFEKIANAVVARLPVDVEPVVRASGRERSERTGRLTTPSAFVGGIAQ
jgi:hypothetical protein